MINYDTLYDYTCTTTLEYTDIVPGPGHTNTTASDFLLGTSTVACHNPILFQTGYLASALVVLSIAWFIYKKLC